jgi:hypothetical protein
MNPDTLKTLKTSVASTPTGCTVTYPLQNNKTENVESPLETLVSLVAACEISILRLLSKKHGFKLGQINLTKVESSFNTALLHGEGGPQNRLNDVYLEGEVETDLEENAFR